MTVGQESLNYKHFQARLKIIDWSTIDLKWFCCISNLQFLLFAILINWQELRFRNSEYRWGMCSEIPSCREFLVVKVLFLISALQINCKRFERPRKQEKNVKWNFCLSGGQFVKLVKNQIDVRSWCCFTYGCYLVWSFTFRWIFGKNYVFKVVNLG